MSANVNTFSNSASHPTYTSPSTGVLNQDQSIDIVSFSFQIHVDSLKHLVHLQAVYRLGPIKPPPVLPGSLGFRIPCQLFSITRFSFRCERRGSRVRRILQIPQCAPSGQQVQHLPHTSSAVLVHFGAEQVGMLKDGCLGEIR